MEEERAREQMFTLWWQKAERERGRVRVREWEREAGKYSKHGLVYVHLPVTFFLQVSPISQGFQNLPQRAGTPKKCI